MPNQVQRPTSLTIICWLYIIGNIFNIVFLVLSFRNEEVLTLIKLSPTPIVIQILIYWIGLIMIIFCSILMLKGKKIGRTLLVSWFGIGVLMHVFMLTFGYTTFTYTSIITYIVTSVILFFLFRSKVSNFFNSHRSSVESA